MPDTIDDIPDIPDDDNNAEAGSAKEQCPARKRETLLKARTGTVLFDEPKTGSRRNALDKTGSISHRFSGLSPELLASMALADVDDDDNIKMTMRVRLAFLIMSQRFEMFVGFVIIVNFFLIAGETDARSMQGSDERSIVLTVINVINVIFLLFYSFECGARLYVQRKRFFNYTWNNFDFFILVTGWIGLVSQLLFEDVFNTQVLRTLRMVRMLRASRILVSFEELHALVIGLKNSMKTLM
jgi:hypothetical protein